jgi:hypothetical protein
MQINDNKYWQYHRNNGITFIGVKEPGKTHVYFKIQTTEGALSISDILNQAYIRENFKDVTVVGGVQFFPFAPNLE